ncbi:MAG: tetratricopeptide repeat protein [Terracidiphilus sp.]|nr:tetratricopeptide repeat protein [Terracidiphilus sp.]
MSTIDSSMLPVVFSPEQIGLVRRHLQEITASHAFAGSKRTQDFLKLIVDHTLEGEIDGLRERMIGAEMFGRPIGYDTGSDSVVRVKATEVRKRLAQYYRERDGTSAVRIELPSGSYVPRFIFEPAKPEVQPLAAAAPPPSAEQSSAEGNGRSAGGPPARSGEAPPLGARKRRLSLLVLAGAVLALATVTVLGYVGFRKWFDAHARTEIHSIAILPLKNLSGDPGQEYFADGMTEELINDLGQVSTLRVISLTSSMSYKRTGKKLPEIARELAVNGVVEGGVLREGNQVRISAQLIDARTDRPIWAHTYLREMSSDLAWQGEVAQAIADEISIKVTPQEQARLSRRRPIDPQAQDFYLRGLLQRDADDCKSAIDYFQKALDKNPNYAEAHAGMANCYGRMGESGRMAYREAFSHQKAEAARAIELDELLPEGHSELANAAMTLDWDWKAAATEFHRALELNPNSAPIHESYAFYLVRTGQLPEALAEVERGVDLDPVSGRSFHYQGFIYYFSHQYEQALSLIRRVRALDITPPDWSFLLGDVYAEKGMYADSIAEFLKSGKGPDSLGHLGNAYARAGQVDAARKTIVELEKNVRKDGVGRYEIALVYAGLGKKQEAFKWLEESYRAKDVGLVYLQVDPCLNPLRSDPRFDDLVRRVGLAK